MRSRCRLWDAQAREDADLQPFVGSTGSLKRAPASVSVFSTHACIERQQALHLALLLYPIVTSSRHKKASGSLLVSACPGREEAVMILNLPLQQNFPVLAALWYLLLWATLQVFSVHWVVAENDINSSNPFCQGGTDVFPLVFPPSIHWSGFGVASETASAQASMSRKLDTWGEERPTLNVGGSQTKHKEEIHLNTSIYLLLSECRCSMARYLIPVAILFFSPAGQVPNHELKWTLSSLSYFVFIFGHHDKKINRHINFIQHSHLV